MSRRFYNPELRVIYDAGYNDGKWNWLTIGGLIGFAVGAAITFVMVTGIMFA